MQEQNTQEKGFTVDRWSIVFIAVAVSIVLIFTLKENRTKYAFYLMGAASLFGIYTATSPAIIRRNLYTGEIKYKGESDCGFTTEPTAEIDGVLFPSLPGKPIYKASNGTDITIAADGTVTPVGFGSTLMQYIRKAGYIKTAPDNCWLEK